MLLVFKNFLSIDECKKLNEWVDLGIENKWLDKGRDINTGWEYSKRLTTRKYADKFNYPEIVYFVSNKITKLLDLQDLQKSSNNGGKDGVVVSCTLDSGNVFKHVDAKEGNLELLRCNVLTRNSKFGGDLYIGDNKIDINVGDLHCYLPSVMEHYVTEVQGETSRVLWMFGYQCSLERFNQLCQSQKQT